MDLGDLIFWIIIGFALFSRAFAWLIERLKSQQPAPPGQVQRPPQRPSPDDFFEDDWYDAEVYEPETARPVPSPVATAAAPRLLVRAGARPAERDVPAPAAAPLLTAAEQGRRLRRQLGLDQRSALQRSVLLMTVLGPCRANEREQGSKQG